MASQFPTKTALALGTAVVALVAYRLVEPTKGLSPTIFPEAAHLTLLRRSPATTKPLNGIQQTGAPSLAVPSPRVGSIPPRPAISPNFIDDSNSLDPFFAALQSLEVKSTNQTVTILHYGDSPTTADLITGDIRDLLQQRFGDAGRGFLLTAKPWAWYQHRGVDITDKNWQTSTAVGKGRAEIYGIGGASFQGDTSASTHITLKDPSQTTIELSFQAQPTGGPITISANGTPIETFPTADPTPHPAYHTTQLPPQTKTIDLHPTGPVRLFGETLLTGHPGVLYDSLGLNGASTSVLSNGFNAEAWQTELRHTQPQLVIINYGTNESSYGPYVDKLYEPTLRTAIARIRTALPGEPILVMSPMDRGRRAGVDQIETYDTIPRIVQIQRRVAADLNCAFFDTFDAMGGDGTMARWYSGHPRLVAGDLIHPTPQGAAIVAHLFVHDLSLAYDRYLGHTGESAQNPKADPRIASSTPATPTSTKPEPPSRTSNPIPANQPQTLRPLEKAKPSAAGEPLPPAPPEPKPEALPPPTAAPDSPQA